MPTDGDTQNIDPNAPPDESTPTGDSVNIDHEHERYAQSAHQALAERQVLERLAIHPHDFIVPSFTATVPSGDANGSITIEEDHEPLVNVLVYPAPPPTVRAIVLTVCHALGHLHGLDMIHRDLTPENLLLSTKGRVKLTGFAVASSRPTGHSLIGTPELMAPEMILAKPYTAAVDWWALGCLTCELLTGQNPFAVPDSSVRDLLRMILYDEIVVPRHENVGSSEHKFMMSLLERDPRIRLGQEGHTQVLAHAWCAGEDP